MYYKAFMYGGKSFKRFGQVITLYTSPSYVFLHNTYCGFKKKVYVCEILTN